MGYSGAWLAVRGKSREAVLETLGLEGTGQREEWPDSKISGAELPDGWYLVVKDHETRVANDKVLAPLSLGGEAITCYILEICMVVCATGWKDGAKIWSVTHDSQRHRTHLEIEG